MLKKGVIRKRIRRERAGPSSRVPASGCTADKQILSPRPGKGPAIGPVIGLRPVRKRAKVRGRASGVVRAAGERQEQEQGQDAQRESDEKPPESGPVAFSGQDRGDDAGGYVAEEQGGPDHDSFGSSCVGGKGGCGANATGRHSGRLAFAHSLITGPWPFQDRRAWQCRTGE